MADKADLFKKFLSQWKQNRNHRLVENEVIKVEPMTLPKGVNRFIFSDTQLPANTKYGPPNTCHCGHDAVHHRVAGPDHSPCDHTVCDCEGFEPLPSCSRKGCPQQSHKSHRLCYDHQEQFSNQFDPTDRKTHFTAWNEPGIHASYCSEHNCMHYFVNGSHLCEIHRDESIRKQKDEADRVPPRTPDIDWV